VAPIDPVTRGLKVGGNGGLVYSCYPVAPIDPVTRGLKVGDVLEEAEILNLLHLLTR
ncbi:MAG: hypothetical protein PWP31_151, partial [Clostridia bacterium]|nr:hypothetical protein [Clostridia bacterium]